jgi:thiol-disulfide isomerase/thioredoxin
LNLRIYVGFFSQSTHKEETSIVSMVAMYRSLTLFAFIILSPPIHAGTPAPDFSLSGDKTQVALADLKGEVIYLDFWASWCTPCRASFPWMNELQRRYGEKGFRVIAVNLDKDRALAARFAKEMQPKFSVLYDDGSIAERYGVQAMPSSFLIDRSGSIVSSHLGFHPNETSALEQAIDRLVNRQKE